MKAPVAVTGGSGFIGREVIARLVQRGWPVRALVRGGRSDLERAGVVVVRGSLENGAALRQLVAGVAAVVHCAGAIRAPSAAAFRLVNTIGSANLMAATAAAATRPRFLLLSSLAAREPALSAYAESKRLGEDEVRRGAGQRIEFCIVRPPAVYGPRDHATLPVFRQLRRGLLFAPAVAEARFSLIYVSDLAEMIVQLLETRDWDGSSIEIHDGRENGYRWQDLAEIAGRQLGSRVRTIAVPLPILWPAAALGQAAGAVLGRSPRFSLGKLRELFHPDWVCRAATSQILPGWSARTTFESGFACTMMWYERNRWL
jgi:nucleoside-diphosphate-sugar epimerase